MNSFDSIKMKIPGNKFDFINLENQKLHTKIENIDERQITERHEIRSIDYGFNLFSLDKLRDEATILISAKILKDNYFNGINLNTFEQLHYELTKHKIFSISKDELIKANVLTIDCTQNIHLEDLKKCVSSVIQHSSINSNYTVKKYDNSGFVATRDVKSYKERTVAYSKFEEIGKKKKEYKNFIHEYPKALVNFTPNTLRFENNFTSFKTMRDYLKFVGEPCLGSILNSQEDVNFKMFERIIKPGKQLELFSDRYNEMSFIDMIKEIGFKSFFFELNNDLKKAKEFIKIKYPRHKHSYYYTLLKEKHSELFGSEYLTQHKYIEEIEQKLKAS
jgi:hypothetical protein